jgi:putative protein-disulfide isomerase
MCSWCYGFSPVIGAIARRFAGQIPIRLVMGGLRAGQTEPMRDKDREYIKGAWARVAQASGQPFDMAFFEREGFVYDTEPVCRAVVTVRAFAPDEALPFMARLSRAFYAQNRDMTQADEIARVAEEHGFPREEFARAFDSAPVRNTTFRDFMVAQEAGIRGFPTLLAGSEADGYMVVTNGFCPLEEIAGPLDVWAGMERETSEAGP